METYIDWMKSCYYVTVAVLPVGVQIVGRPRDDFGVLRLAHAFEEATGFWRHHPLMGRDTWLQDL